jgi:hypothetical protein
LLKKSTKVDPASKEPVHEELKSAYFNEEYFGMKEAAIFLKLSISAMQKISAKKVIPVYKPNNGKVYFKKSDLLNYLQCGKQAHCSKNEEEVHHV